MGGFWAAFVTWFQGKKTILGGLVVVGAGVTGVWIGKLDPASGAAVVGTGLSIAGFAAKANRHQAQILAGLQGVAQAAADVKAGNKAKAIDDAETTAAEIGISLVPQTGPAAPASTSAPVTTGK